MYNKKGLINKPEKFSISECKEGIRAGSSGHMEIGPKIKQLRTRNGLTLEELASRCELTKGFLSQLERDLTSPSIATLADILEALGSSLSEFFQEDSEEQVVFRKDDFFVDERDTCTIRWIVPNTQKNEMEPILIELPSGGKSFPSGPHAGEEFGYVVDGGVVLVLGDRRIKVRAGETFYLDGSCEHYLCNERKTTARVLWVSTPPLF